MKKISSLLAVLLVAGIMALGGTQVMAGEADEHEAYFQDVITGATE